MNTILNKKIAIIGGGPGGLALARHLQMQGAEVKVYKLDRNKDLSTQGTAANLRMRERA